MKKIKFLILVLAVLNLGCNAGESFAKDEEAMDNNSGENIILTGDFNILSLGDSYTIGQSVCESCRFPEQLKDSLKLKFESDSTIIELDVIARTGWTTTNLINAVNSIKPSNNYNLVTLLIGVNNQFQKRDFNLYENEFVELVNKAIFYAKGDINNVIVISIPDYAYTPFGREDPDISEAIDRYNLFAKNYCDTNKIDYINVTDITRMGLTNPTLVASDGLHPSELAYSQFVQRILPVALEKLKD